MTSPQHDTSLGEGVYFAPGDYVGITRRIIILVVDVLVILLTYGILYASYVEVFRHEPTDAFYWGIAGLIWAYLTFIKASPLRTVGYWLMDARILNLRGERPSVIRMTFRLMLWLFGPFNLIFDLFWAGSDDDRQTLRDRFAGTCVVKNSAQPLGTGEIHFAYYDAMGLNLMYPRVVRPSLTGSTVAAESPEAI